LLFFSANDMVHLNGVNAINIEKTALSTLHNNSHNATNSFTYIEQDKNATCTFRIKCYSNFSVKNILNHLLKLWINYTFILKFIMSLLARSL